jgi:hypothetical protein
MSYLNPLDNTIPFILNIHLSEVEFQGAVPQQKLDASYNSSKPRARLWQNSCDYLTFNNTDPSFCMTIKKYAILNPLPDNPF